MILQAAQLLTGSRCREVPPAPGKFEEPSQLPGFSAISETAHLFLHALSICFFFYLRTYLSVKKKKKASGCVHLELINKALSNIQRLVWIP